MMFSGFIALAQDFFPQHAEYFKNAKDEKSLYEFVLEECRKTVPENNEWKIHDYTVLKLVSRGQLKALERNGRTLWETKAKK